MRTAEDSCCALDRLQWVRNGLTLTTADDYNSKVLSERGGAGQRVGYTKTGLRASPNRITQNHHAGVSIARAGVYHILPIVYRIFHPVRGYNCQLSDGGRAVYWPYTCARVCERDVVRQATRERDGPDG